MSERSLTLSQLERDRVTELPFTAFALLPPSNA